MEQGVTNFLRDLTEVRKTGLSPEKCIESLSKRDYGTFSKELRKISSEISWGIPIKKGHDGFSSSYTKLDGANRHVSAS